MRNNARVIDLAQVRDRRDRRVRIVNDLAAVIVAAMIDEDELALHRPRFATEAAERIADRLQMMGLVA